MKKKILGPEKAFTYLGMFGRKSFSKKNQAKIRRRRIVKLIFKEKRPPEGFKTYTVRRSKPYHTWDASLMPEDSKHYWKEVEEYVKEIRQSKQLCRFGCEK